MESAQARYFVALLPPLSVQQEAQQFKQHFQTKYGSKAALKSPPHITLQPPFLWSREATASLHQSLETFTARFPPVPVELSGFGAFSPRVIYIDVGRTAELMALQPSLMNYLAAELEIVDKRSQQRRFAPHLTIAFRDLRPTAFRQAWPEFKHRPYHASFVATALTLLIHDGQRWQVSQNFNFQS